MYNDLGIEPSLEPEDYENLPDAEYIRDIAIEDLTHILEIAKELRKSHDTTFGDLSVIGCDEKHHDMVSYLQDYIVVVEDSIRDLKIRYTY